MRTRSTPLLLIASAATLACVVACDRNADASKSATQPAATQPFAVRLVPIDRAPVPDTVDFVGTLYGDEEALIASKVSGRIIAVLADLGDRVDDGTPLAKVDPTDYEFVVQQRQLALQEALAKIGLSDLPAADFDVAKVATVRRAAVQAENAKARLDRSKQLFEQDVPLISPQEYADTRTQYEVAQQDYDVAVLDVRSSLAQAQSRAAELGVARQQLGDTQIRAPFASTRPTTQPNTQPATQPAGQPARGGRWAIAERRTNIGEYVQAGTVVYRVIADQPIKLRASIPERFLGRVAAGQPVALVVDASGASTPGVVSRVSPAVDVASRTFAVEVTFANADRVLRPGSFGRGAITVGTRTDVSTVPPAALYSFAGLDKVFTVKDGKAVANLVNVLVRDVKRIVVEGNLGGAGEAITGNLARLSNGAPVTTK